MAPLLALVLAGCNSLGGVGGIPIQRDLDDPMSAAVGGVEGCVVDEATVVPEAAEIDDVIGVESGLPGVMHVGGVELFVGTLEVAAHQLGGRVLFVGRDGRAWLRMAPGEARELVAIETPAGHQVWFLDDSATAGPC